MGVIFRYINGICTPLFSNGNRTTTSSKKKINSQKIAINNSPFFSIESFTIPGAKCPVCGDTVFFYQSCNGGKVYFDELGPPWPKHPCTNREINTEQIVSKTNAKNMDFLWQKNNWMPFLVSDISSKNKSYRLKGILGKNDKIIYVKKGKWALSKKFPFFLRKEKHGYSLATVLVDKDGNTTSLEVQTANPQQKTSSKKKSVKKSNLVEHSKQTALIYDCPRPITRKRRYVKLERIKKDVNINRKVKKNRGFKETSLSIAFKTALNNKT